MTYNKPEVVRFASAVEVIQGSGPKFVNSFPDIRNQQELDALTIGAYESDE